MAKLGIFAGIGNEEKEFLQKDLKAFRKEIGVSKAKLADCSDVSEDVIDAIENGRKSVTWEEFERIFCFFLSVDEEKTKMFLSLGRIDD